MEKVIIYTDGACSGNPGPGRMGNSAILQRKQKRNMGKQKKHNK